MTDLLMRTPAPVVDESPRAYLIRLSEMNGYESPFALIDLLHEGSLQQVTSGWDYSQLTAILGSHCQLPPDFGYRSPGVKVREHGQLLGNAIQTRHLGLYKARVCASCLRELGYVPAVWDLKAYLACPTHGHLMLKYCASCGTRVTYRRPGVATCTCGADLRDQHVEAAPPALVAFCEVLHALATGSSGCVVQAQYLGMPINNLMQMDLDVFVKVAITIANVYQAMAAWRPTPRQYTQLVEALPDAANALIDWPRNFEVLCKQWHENAPARMRDDGFQAKFEWLFVRLHKNLREKAPQTKFMLEAACAYGNRRWDTRPVLIKNKHIDPSALPMPRYGSASAAAKLLGVDSITAARWAASGRIPATRSGKSPGNRNWCVDLDAIRQFRFSKFARVDHRMAAREIKISLPVFSELRKSGAIGSTHFVVGRAGAVAREDLDLFKTDLLSKCVEPPNDVETMPLLAVLAHKSPVLQAEIVRGVLTGAIPVYGVSVEGFDGMLVEKPRRIDPDPPPASEPKPVTHLNLKQAKEQFGLWEYEVRAIALWLGLRPWRGRGLKSIEIKKFNRFFARYVLVRRIAEQYGLLSLQLVRAIRRLRPGVLTTIAPPEGLQGAYLIHRKHVSYARGVARRLVKTRSSSGSRP